MTRLIDADALLEVLNSKEIINLRHVIDIITNATAVEQSEPVGDKQTPYSNCQFQICDLPGQCRGEGKCHHPAYTSPISKECEPARDLLETDDGKWDGTIKALWRRLQGRHPSAEFWNLSEIPDDEMYIFRAHFATALLASPIKQLNAEKG